MKKILGAMLAFGPTFGLIYATGGWEPVFLCLGVLIFFALLTIGACLMVSDLDR